MVTYDYPLSEKIRTLLRIEDLYEKILFFAQRTEARDHHVALQTVFEILEVGSRADLKSDLLQELERQRQALEGLRGNPTVQGKLLEEVLADIERTTTALLGVAGKFGQHLRENEWLMSIRQRSAIPGGLCEFDLPSYHYWLHLEADARHRDLSLWLKPLLPIRDGLHIVLKLLRESGKPLALVAPQGVYQQSPPQRIAQMLRVGLPAGLTCVPEISANKYALNIRFITPGGTERPHLYEHDVAFQLTYCSL